jgi:predicted nucleic acid-binding protein
VSLTDWGDGDLLVDNSIYARRDHPLVADRWQQATEAGRLILVQPMLMEVLYSAKNGDAARDQLQDLQAAYEVELIDDDVWDLAIATQARLARVGNGYQRRYSITDLLTAALADRRGYGVLHYDADYDELGRDGGLRFASVWAAAPPSLDGPPDPEGDAKALRRSLRLLLGTLDDVQDAELLTNMFTSLSDQARRVGITPAPRRRSDS